jgi:hypothetical protein
MRWVILILLMVGLTGCEGDAVVFAPTPLPPDLSPITYTHPDAVFSVQVPRHWTVYHQQADDLATASFTPPQATYPALIIGVIQLGTSPEALDLINEYGANVRLNGNQYTEQERQAMRDGSWRLIGVTRPPGGLPREVNTFIQQADGLVAVIEADVSGDPVRLNEIERAMNTLTLSPTAELAPAPLERLNDLSVAPVRVANVNAWTTPQGVYFVTGEVVNTSTIPLESVPLDLRLLRADGAELGQAQDRVMGYRLPVGGYAPFSLRFGQGRPPDASQFMLQVGGTGWVPTPTDGVIGSDGMTWTDDSSITDEGHLLIQGEVTNESGDTLYDPLAVITVFDANQNVIAAGFAPVTEGPFDDGDTREYFLRIQEIGGLPANYIIEVQARAQRDF